MITAVHAQRQEERAIAQQEAPVKRTEEDSAPAPAANAHSLTVELGQLVKLSKVCVLLEGI